MLENNEIIPAMKYKFNKKFSDEIKSNSEKFVKIIEFNY